MVVDRLTDLSRNVLSSRFSAGVAGDITNMKFNVSVHRSNTGNTMLISVVVWGGGGNKTCYKVNSTFFGDAVFFKITFPPPNKLNNVIRYCNN